MHANFVASCALRSLQQSLYQNPMSKPWFDELLRWEKFQEKQQRKRDKRDYAARAELNEKLMGAITNILPTALSMILPQRSSAAAAPDTEKPILLREEDLTIMHNGMPAEQQKILQKILQRSVGSGHVEFQPKPPAQPAAESPPAPPDNQPAQN